MAKDFDAVLDRVGSYGLYQRKMLWIVVVPTAFIIAMQVGSLMFQTIIPDHWCAVPGQENTNMTTEQWKNFTIPATEDASVYRQCEQYTVRWRDGLPYHDNRTQECSSWVFDRSIIYESLATTNQWVCHKALYSVHVFSVNLAGNSLSTLILPYLSDACLGRRLMFFVAVGLHFVFNILVIFISNFKLHILARFLAGFCFSSNYQLSFMIAMELISPDQRAYTAFVSWVAWTVGMCLTPALTYFVGYWHYAVVALVVMDLYMFSLWWYLPESPRWLLTQHRYQETADILLQVAKTNGRGAEVKEDLLLQELRAVGRDQDTKVPLLSIVGYPKFLLRCVALIVISSGAFFGHGLLAFDINVLPDRYYLNFFLLSLVALPSDVAAWLCCQFGGRRFTAIACYAACVVVGFAAVAVVEHKVLLLVVVCALKWLSTMAIYALYLQVAELYPTCLRSTGMGSIAVFGTATLSTVPYIISSDVPAALKYWIFIATSALCLVFSLPLPETLALPMPQSLPEAEQLASNRPLGKWVHHWNLDKYSPPDAVLNGIGKEGCAEVGCLVEKEDYTKKVGGCYDEKKEKITAEQRQCSLS